MPIQNNSKRISEIRSLNELPKNPQDSWIPIAQYNSRINSYTNIRVNIDSILSYCVLINDTTIKDYHIDDWAKFWRIGYGTTEDGTSYVVTDKKAIETAIKSNPVADNLVSYTLEQTISIIDYFGWAGYPTMEDNLTTVSALEQQINAE